MNVSYIGKGTWFEYDIDVPDTNKYRLQLRAAVSTATSANIYLEHRFAGYREDAGKRRLAQKWITVSSPKIRFREGKQNHPHRIQCIRLELQLAADRGCGQRGGFQRGGNARFRDA